jgi:hypothetical protein
MAVPQVAAPSLFRRDGRDKPCHDSGSVPPVPWPPSWTLMAAIPASKAAPLPIEMAGKSSPFGLP